MKLLKSQALRVCRIVGFRKGAKRFIVCMLLGAKILSTIKLIMLEMNLHFVRAKQSLVEILPEIEDSTKSMTKEVNNIRTKICDFLAP